MRKIFALIGEPATGKSSILRRFIQSSDDRRPGATWEEREEIKLVPTLYMSGSNLHILGRYPDGETFGGTDRFSMAVQPQAVKFIQNSNANILFEGDRLGNQSFLEFLADQPLTELKIFFVTATDKTIDERHITRKDEQSEIFKKGRRTKIDNLRSNMVLMGYSQEMVNETVQDLYKNVQYLINQLILG